MNQILKHSIDKKDFIKCEFCDEKLYRQIFEIELYGSKRNVKLNYERCKCKKAQKFWEDYEEKKAKLIEEEQKLKLIQEFSEKVERTIKNSRMSKRNLNYKFVNFEENENNKNVLKNLKKYTQNLVDDITKKGVIIVGPNGVGKTHLACSIANELMINGKTVIYGNLINLLSEIRNSYNMENNINELEILKLYKTAKLLIIDDLGKEKPSEWGLEKLFTIINSRYENDLPVVITTNYNQEALINRLSINGDFETAKSIISRLYEMCYLVKIDDKDHRIKTTNNNQKQSHNCDKKCCENCNGDCKNCKKKASDCATNG